MEKLIHHSMACKLPGASCIAKSSFSGAGFSKVSSSASDTSATYWLGIARSVALFSLACMLTCQTSAADIQQPVSGLEQPDNAVKKTRGTHGKPAGSLMASELLQIKSVAQSVLTARALYLPSAQQEAARNEMVALYEEVNQLVAESAESAVVAKGEAGAQAVTRVKSSFEPSASELQLVDAQGNVITKPAGIGKAGARQLSASPAMADPASSERMALTSSDAELGTAESLNAQSLGAKPRKSAVFLQHVSALKGRLQNKMQRNQAMTLSDASAVSNAATGIENLPHLNSQLKQIKAELLTILDDADNADIERLTAFGQRLQPKTAAMLLSEQAAANGLAEQPPAADNPTLSTITEHR